MKREIIALGKARKDLQQIIGNTIAEVWRWHGMYIAIEIGNLFKYCHTTPKGPVMTSLRGDWTLSIHGAWRVVQENRVVIDIMKDKDVDIDKSLEQLRG